MHNDSRIVGASAKRIITPANDTIEIDWERFLFNIVFSDHYVLDSMRLREIPFLVRKFGYLGVKSLFQSNDFSFQCETYNVGLFNLNTRHYLYKIVAIDVIDRDEHLRGCLEEKGFNDELDGFITKHHKIELIESIKEKLLPYPVQPLVPISEAIVENFNDVTLLKKIIARRVFFALGKVVRWYNLEVKVFKEKEETYYLNNNLSKLIKIDETTAHKIIGDSISAFCYQHILAFKMNHNKAFGCYREGEESILLDCLPSLTNRINTDNQLHSFHKVLRIEGLPALSSIEGLGISKLLDLKRSPEYLDFRKWLNVVSDLSDEEIKKELNHKASILQAKISGPIVKTISKILFFSLRACGNFNPIQECSIDAAMESAPWLAKRIFSTKGHAVFLHRDYRSVFE